MTGTATREGLPHRRRHRRHDANAQRRDGRTALHFAVAKGKANALAALLAAGADPNTRDRDALAPLHSAAADPEAARNAAHESFDAADAAQTVRDVVIANADVVYDSARGDAASAFKADSNAGPGTGAPLLALHVNKWKPSPEDFFLAATAGLLALQDSGIVSPEFSSGVTTYTAKIGDATGVLVIAVSTSNTTITIDGAAADGTALNKKLEINHAAQGIEAGDVRIEDVLVAGAGFIDMVPGKNIITIRTDMGDDNPTPSYVVELTR